MLLPRETLLRFERIPSFEDAEVYTRMNFHKYMYFAFACLWNCFVGAKLFDRAA